MRRLAIGLLITAVGLGLFTGSAGAGAGDGEGEGDSGADAVATTELGRVDVLLVSGLFDRLVVEAIEGAIDDAVAADAQALIIQVNSRGAVVGDERMEELLGTVAASPVPIAVWVGPSSARLYGTPAQLLAVADVTGMAPGARVGHTGELLSPPGVDIDFGDATTRLRTDSVGLSDARDLGVLRQRVPDEGIPTLTSMVNALDGYAEGGRVLETTEDEVLDDDGTVRRTTIAPVRQSSLPFVDRLFHTVASPAITYLLLLVGLALLVFEFFTAGVGVAGVVGAGALVLACTGLAALPARGWAVGLIIVSMLAFADRRAGRDPEILDGGRNRRHGHRQCVVVRVAPRGDAAAVVDHPPRRHRRHGRGVRRRHAVDGADPVRHADDRSGVVARRARRGRRGRRPRRRRQGRRRQRGGRGRTGRPRWPSALRSASSPSTGSRSRSSRSKEPPATTVNGAGHTTTSRRTTRKPCVNTVAGRCRDAAAFLRLAAW